MKLAPLTLCVLLLPFAASAQTTPPATPAPLNSAPANAITASPAPFNPSLPPITSLPSQPAPATAAPKADPPGTIRLNFQNASLADVLSYLSSAAGFIILQEAPVAGTVSVVSAQPVSPDEAVDLLNAVLVEKGYIAMRSGRILKIVSRQDAEKRDLPVMTGSDPAEIPRKDNLVTQILPVRYADVTKLIDNISPLLPATAKITSNTSSNAIVLTDTQTDIHRMAEIIRALDTSISGISTIHVYPLRYGDAKAMADVLTQLFSPSTSGQNNNPFANLPFFLGGRGGAPGGGGRGGGGNGGTGPATAPESEARQAASRVVAVSDDQSNSVIVSAPEEYLTTITGIVEQLDTPTSDITETRIFALQHADATETANILATLYSATTSSSTTPSNNQQQRGNQGGPQRQPQPQPQGNQANANRSERALLQAAVAVVADARTNAVLVSASHETMSEIALTIGRLDQNSAKKQHVHVYTLSHADPDNVAAILKGMFTVDSTNSTTSIQPSLSRLTNRTTTGASSDISDTLNTNSNSGTSH